MGGWGGQVTSDREKLYGFRLAQKMTINDQSSRTGPDEHAEQTGPGQGYNVAQHGRGRGDLVSSPDSWWHHAQDAGGDVRPHAAAVRDYARGDRNTTTHGVHRAIGQLKREGDDTVDGVRSHPKPAEHTPRTKVVETQNAGLWWVQLSPQGPSPVPCHRHSTYPTVAFSHVQAPFTHPPTQTHTLTHTCPPNKGPASVVTTRTPLVRDTDVTHSNWTWGCGARRCRAHPPGHQRSTAEHSKVVGSHGMVDTHCALLKHSSGMGDPTQPVTQGQHPHGDKPFHKPSPWSPPLPRDPSHPRCAAPPPPPPPPPPPVPSPCKAMWPGRMPCHHTPGP